MMRYGWLLVPVLAMFCSSPAPAGILFFRKAKPNPAERVPELIKIVKENPDEKLRAAAAEELRQFDPQSYPQIVPTLIEVLQRDEGWTVRLAAADTLGKLRPVEQQVGYALEQTAANDKAMRVRMTARSSLWQYYIHGYRPAKSPETGANGNQSGEPPLAKPGTPPAPTGTPSRGESAEPPLAVPQSSVKPARSKDASKQTSVAKSTVPAPPPLPKKASVQPQPPVFSVGDEGGPALNLPQ